MYILYNNVNNYGTLQDLKACVKFENRLNLYSNKKALLAITRGLI
ncbi:hypothetical protein QE431_002202 [Flavobacterium sp. SORGH_AS 622]|nr:hypothetical protein [Flavobacterium sp. SORGH_AS_0622]